MTDCESRLTPTSISISATGALTLAEWHPRERCGGCPSTSDGTDLSVHEAAQLGRIAADFARSSVSASGSKDLGPLPLR